MKFPLCISPDVSFNWYVPLVSVLLASVNGRKLIVYFVSNSSVISFFRASSFTSMVYVGVSSEIIV